MTGRELEERKGGACGASDGRERQVNVEGGGEGSRGRSGKAGMQTGGQTGNAGVVGRWLVG